LKDAAAVKGGFSLERVGKEEEEEKKKKKKKKRKGGGGEECLGDIFRFLYLSGTTTTHRRFKTRRRATSHFSV